MTDVDFHHTRADKAPDVATFALDGVSDFRLSTSRPVADAYVEHTDHQEL
ncbi:hypothetical protein GCM10029964_040450 [Kibdelosporangium lantanae]